MKKHDLLTEALRIKREQGRKSIGVFAELFFSHYIKHKTTKAHREIYELLQRIIEERGKKIAIAAPRGFGKSTLITLIYISYCLCYDLEKYIVIVSNTASQAEQILDNIKRELRGNGDLMAAFPEICNVGKVSRLVHWKKDSIVVGVDSQVMTFGSRQNVRGIRRGANRPGLIIADDLENAKNTFSVSSRENLRDFFEKSVIKSGDEKTNVIILGNTYHPFSLLGEYLKDDSNNSWTHLRYATIVKMPDNLDMWGLWGNIYNFKSDFEGGTGPKAAAQFYASHKEEMDRGAILLWPERYTLYYLMCLREDNEISFMSEMQNEPIDHRLAIFKTDEFHYWDANGRTIDEHIKSIGANIEFYAGCDLALGKSLERGDYSAIVILAKDKETGTLYILKADVKRRPIEELVDDILSYCTKYKFTKFGVESNGFQVIVTNHLKRRAEELRLNIPFEEVISKGDKVSRIQALKLYTKNGTIQFNNRDKELLEECRYFPKCKFDDALDALEMAVSLAAGGRTFSIEEQLKIFKSIAEQSKKSICKDFLMQNGKIIPNPFGLLDPDK